MGNIDRVEIEKTSKHLVSVGLELESRYFSLASVLLDRLVEIAWEIIHDDIQILLFGLIREETVSDLEGVRVVESFEDL